MGSKTTRGRFLAEAREFVIEFGFLSQKVDDADFFGIHKAGLGEALLHFGQTRLRLFQLVPDHQTGLVFDLVFEFFQTVHDGVHQLVVQRPESLVQEVVAFLKEHAAADEVVAMPGVEENVAFPLPKGLREEDEFTY